MSLYAAIPITQLVIGVPNLNECTIQPMIPKWMIVSGAFGLFVSVMNGFINFAKFIK